MWSGKDIKGVEGLDARYVEEKALMKKLVDEYDELTTPAINVPRHSVREN